MDGARFDAFTRCLTSTSSRRRALAAALGEPLGMLGLTAAAKKKCNKKNGTKQPNCRGFRPIRYLLTGSFATTEPLIRHDAERVVVAPWPELAE
jgi:hypothetical protein